MPEPVDEEMSDTFEKLNIIDEQPGSDKNSKSYKIATLKTPIIDTIFNYVNPSLTNVPFTDKPGNLFLLAKCLKNTCGRVTF